MKPASRKRLAGYPQGCYEMIRSGLSPIPIGRKARGVTPN